MKSVGLSLLLASILYSAPISISKVEINIANINAAITKIEQSNIENNTKLEKYIISYNKTTSVSGKKIYMNAIEVYKTLIEKNNIHLEELKVSLEKANTVLKESTGYYNKPVEVVSLPQLPVNSVTTTPEYTKTYSKLGVATAWNQGYTGKGVTVAIIDSGISNKSADLTKFLSSAVDIGSVKQPNGLTARTFTSYGAITDIGLNLSSEKKVYSVAPTVEIVGNGTGATALAKLDKNGYLSYIIMSNMGEGYTGDVTVRIIDANGNVDTSVTTKPYIAGVDYYGHGTSVASLIAGQPNGTGVVGIAYDANLISLKAGNPTISNLDAVDLLRVAVSKGAKVINQSFETYSVIPSTYVNEYKKILDSDVAIVTAAGNKGYDCLTSAKCNSWATIPTQFDYKSSPGAYIVVGALNEDQTDIATFSNKAGLTKDFYILAPGTKIEVSSLTGGIATMSGTSFAAPIVTGTMALLKQKWPQLSSAQQAQIMFQTADDMGVAGVDEVYGHGKLNIDKAFSPVGDLKVPMISQNFVGKSSATTYVTSFKTSVTGGTMMTSKLSSLVYLDNTIAVDNFNRDFNVNVTEGVKSTKESFAFKNFVNVPMGKNWIVGISNIEDAPMVGYKIGNSILKYSYTEGYFGSEGEGILSFKGNTHYFGYDYSNVEDNSGIEVSAVLGYAKVTESNINLSDGISLGVQANALYEGFGVFGQIPGMIIKGSMKTTLPTGVTDGGDYEFETVETSLAMGDFEYKGGLMFKNGNTVVTMDKTYNSYGIKGFGTNNLRLSYNLSF